MTASGGWGNITYALKSPSVLLGNLTLNSTTGVISGTPSTPGNFTFTIVASDSASPTKNTVEREFRLGVSGMDPLAWTVNPAPVSGKVAIGYNATLGAASGGSGNYSYSSNNSTLPPGLSFNAATRLISGTPTTPGTYNVSLTVRDNFGGATANATLGNSTVQTVPIVIDPYGMSINGTDTIVGDQYATITPSPFTAVGGTANYTWSATWSGNATALVINPTSGTSSLTSTPGNYTMIVSLRDGRNQTANKTVAVQIRPRVMSWATAADL
ncbi:MAG: putative Ig domain-containing protein, partial [Spartobacteria bacterium]